MEETLYNRSQVLFEGTYSSICVVDSGVPHGRELGFLLLLVFINDLPDSVTSDAQLFADDCMLNRVVNINAGQLQLQEDLHQLGTWGKTTYKYSLHSQVLEVTKESDYIVVTISNDLIWENHISNITAKANCTIGFLSRNMHACQKEVKAAAYTTIVRPSIEYTSDVGPIQQKTNIPTRPCTTTSCRICIERLSRARIRSSYIYNLQLKMGIH